MPIRPFIAAGVALASAGAIVAATPAVLPTQQTMVMADVPAALAKKSLTVNQVKLLSLSDITVQAIVDAYVYGWGGGVLEDDPYYPVDPDDYPILVPGTAGVAYYVGDQALETLKDAGIPLVHRWLTSCTGTSAATSTRSGRPRHCMWHWQKRPAGRTRTSPHSSRPSSIRGWRYWGHLPHQLEQRPLSR